MTFQEKIARINELYKKQKTVGLNEEEKKEQAKLRREYVDSVKSNLKSQLDNIKIVKADNNCANHQHTHHHKGCNCSKH